MRASVAIALGLAAAIVAFSAAAGITGWWPVAVPLAALAGGLVGWRAWRRPFVPLDETACSRGLGIVSGLATIVALVQLARLAVFMVDPSQVAYSSVPSSAWEVRHSCLTAYFVAARAASDGRDIFDPTLYTAPEDTGAGVRKAQRIGPFGVDVYEYPPPFLLLPRAVMLVTPDFMHLRPFWFALNVGVVLAAMLVVARRLGPAAGTRALLMIPLVWAALPTTSFLQKGNIQGVVVAMSMLAMVLLERRRFAGGSALLAYAMASKLFPGLLLVYLTARRQWRAVAWTGAMGVVITVVMLAYAGTSPFVAFFHHLPGLLGGEAFPAFRNPGARAINFSVPGLVFKAGLFGVPGMGFPAAKVLGWIWTVVILWIIVRVSRQPVRPADGPAVWLAILIVATLRSPFLPQAYAAFPPLWLLTVLAARYAPAAKTLSLTVLAWLALNVFWPLDWPIDPRWLAVLSGVPQAVTMFIALWVLRPALVRERPGLPEAELRGSPAAPAFE